MQKQQKMVALAGILAIVASITVVSTLEQVQAENIGTAGDLNRLSPNSFGSNTNVCGDRLCDEPRSVIHIEESHNVGSISSEDPSAPTASLISIDRYAPGPNQKDAITYKITYRVTTGTENLKDIQIHAVSDLGEWDLEISSLVADSNSVNVARLKAMDPASITGEIVHYTVVVK